MVGPQGPTTDWRQSLHRIQRHCCFLFSHGCTGTAHGSSDLLITKFEIEHRRGEFPTSTWLFPSYCELGRLYIRLMHASGMQAWMCMCHNLSEEAFVATCQIKFLLMSIYIYITCRSSPLHDHVYWLVPPSSHHCGEAMRVVCLQFSWTSMLQCKLVDNWFLAG